MVWLEAVQACEGRAMTRGRRAALLGVRVSPAAWVSRAQDPLCAYLCSWPGSGCSQQC